jgi:hypothetical protein
LSRKRFLPVFINEEGRPFVPTAKRVWDLAADRNRGRACRDRCRGVGEVVRGIACRRQYPRRTDLHELLTEHRARIKEERERAVYAFEARGQAIGRIGLPAVREHRRKRLQQNTMRAWPPWMTWRPACRI